MNANRRKIRASAAAIVWVGLLAALHSPVLALEPTTPDQIVTVAQDLGSSNCTNTGRKFDTLLAPDGTATPFSIPAGQVLVVTAVELLGFGATPGLNIQTRIFRGIGLTVNLAAIRESLADVNGRIFHIYQLSPGVVVASGGEVCANNNSNLTTTGKLRGYLTPASSSNDQP